MTTTSPLHATSWGESVAAQLLDSSRCPVCQGMLESGCCVRCGSDLRGPIGVSVWDVSLAAASALRAREALLRKIPVVSTAPDPAPTAAPTTAVAPPTPTAATPPPPGIGSPAPERSASSPQSSATLQSVLATTGAALFAVAAIVFTYFNPDLADRALRSVIVALVTLLFLGGAWILSRRGLRFSAEAVGGLGLVFAGLDIHAVAQLTAPEVDPWFTTAIATAAVGSAMLVAGRRGGIRTWTWTALLALQAVPVMLGAVGGSPLGFALGVIGAAYAGAAIVERLRPTSVERGTLIATQLVASLVALIAVWRVEVPGSTAYLLTVSGLLLLIAVHAVIAARGPIAGLWAYGAGGVGSAALVIAAYGLTGTGVIEWSWLFLILPAAASLALVLIGAVIPLPRRVPRGFVAGGAVTVLAGPVLVVLAQAALVAVGAVSAFVRGAGGDVTLWDPGWGVPLGLLSLCIGLGAFGALAREREGIRRLAVPVSRVSLGFGALAVLVVGCSPLLPLPGAVVVLTASVVLAAAALRFARGVTAPTGVRVILLVAVHIAIVASAMIAWRDPDAVPLAGAATLVAVVAVAAVQPSRWRFAYVGAGFAYALVLTATALGQAGIGGIAQLCLTASAGLIVAIAATYIPRIGARPWQAILVVSAVPFGIGVLQVVVERSGWTALSTGLMFALALSLLLTRRPGLTLVVRTAAAAMLMPTLAVVVVCLGAQLLASSGSPVVLPIIAVLVALVLPSTALIRSVLVARGHSLPVADAALVAIEGSSLLTGAIATGLAVAREAAGLGTTFLVLLILGLGAAAGALFAGRRFEWAVAGAAFTGALWCVWGLTGVDLLEAYLLPPTLGAALVAAVLTSRGQRATGLYAAGLLIAVIPLLALIALVEPDSDAGDGAVWRVVGLLLAAWALLGLALVLGRAAAGSRLRRLRSLRLPTLLAAGAAATAGTIQGVRFGLGWDAAGLHGAALFLSCLGVSAVGAAVLVLAARGVRGAAGETSRLRSSRWLLPPAAVALALGTWPAIERDWFSIWAMWALMVGCLIAVVISAARGIRGATTAPPVWFLFAIAFVTAIVAWSPRDLRVEWFSLPLGAFLLLAGALAMRGSDAERSPSARPTLDSWPGRWTGSWPLLAPGIVTMMIASIVSTFTDPLTWRAILVMVLALAAILVGSRGRLAAPFLLGLIVLPIENVFVFSVQIGRGIESMPWWITLAVMGAVLLIIAVTAERRTGEAGSVAARIRDLR